MAGKIKALIVVLIIIGLVGAGYSAILFLEPKTEAPKQEPEKEIDDRISPLTTQAVFFEVNRIRRKGIINHMMYSGFGAKLVNKIKDGYLSAIIDGCRPGFGWREKPIFNYIAVLDGYEWDGRQDFETWNTDYINQEIFRQVEEEQEKTEIEFKFIEIEKKFEKIKILTKRIEREVESFKVEYDFKTGRWTGDDSFNDSDGYGHYNGSQFELWFNIRQTDFDANGIPYWAEVNVLETNPRVDDSKFDPDEDGIPTSWEWEWGYDPFRWGNHTYLDPDNDGLQNVEEWYMAKWLANPYRPDIYIETDHMEKAPFKPFHHITQNTYL